MEEILKLILQSTGEGKLERDTAINLIAKIKEEQKKEVNTRKDIAVIGVAGRFPMANDARHYWQNILNGINCVSDFPEYRKNDTSKYFEFKNINPESISYSRGAFMADIDKFDHKFFGISHDESKLMDPAQRLFLEVVYHTFEDAGYTMDKLAGSNTGIYVGYSNNIKDNYGRIIYDTKNFGGNSIIGNVATILPNRISYLMDLKGPSMIVDTACSSSLVAVATACDALRNGACDMAIAGGVRICLMPVDDINERMGIESEDGKTRAFDDDANGTGLGEGVAAILLKPLSKALEDGDSVYAVIKGTAVNQDGSSIGLTAPNPSAQAELLIKAWNDAQVEPESISYIETHGTATNLGDPTEIKGFNNAFGKFTDKKQFCGIGSVKSNVGHLYEAAGIANIIKAIFSLNYKKLPASILFEKPNRYIDFTNSSVYINTKLRDWNLENQPRRCGVSAFGIGGTNCHIVLEEAPELPSKHSDTSKPLVFTFSAKTGDSLIENIKSFRDFLIMKDEEISLSDISYTLLTGRMHYQHRLAIVAKDLPELSDKLSIIEDINSLKESDLENVFYGETEPDSVPLNISFDKPVEEICSLFVSGKFNDWKNYFNGINGRIVRIPNYCFEKTRCWVDIKVTDVKNWEPVEETHVETDSDNLENTLIEMFKEVLELDDISAEDNLFDLGLDSILMVDLVNRINKEFNVKITYNQFIKKKNILDVMGMLPCEKPSEVQAISIYKNIKPDIDNIYSPFPLTEVQKAYLLGRSDSFEMGNISTHGYMEIETKLDPVRLAIAMQKVVDRHPMLRAVFIDDKQQILNTNVEYNLEIVDLRGYDNGTKEERILVQREEMSHEVLDPKKLPLINIKAFRLTDELNYLFISLDMLIADGGSIQIFFNELLEFYQNPEKQLSTIGITFRDYMLAYEDFKNSETYAKDKAYWLSKLPDFPMAPALPLKKDPSLVKVSKFKRLSKSFEKREWESFKQRAREKNVTLSAVLCTAYSEVLAFWSNQSRIALNLTVFNRYPFHEDINKLMGDFTSVILVGVDLNKGNSFIEKVANVQDTLMDSLEHRHFEGVEFIRELSKHHGFGARAAMPVVFTSMLLNDRQGNSCFEQLGDIKYAVSQTPQVFLDHQASDITGVLELNWDYAEELFEQETIEKMFEQYVAIVEKFITHDQEIEVEVFGEQKQLIENYNNTDEDIRKTTLHELFMDQAEKTPLNVAVIYEEDKMTYEELDKRSNQIAAYLKELGVNRNEYVGVLAKRCIDSIVNMMGVLKAGAAYIPIDPGYPEDRVNYIREKSNMKAFLVPESYQTHNIGKLSDRRPDIINTPEDIAYSIFTSGSTGMPKGVVINHMGAANTILDINNKFQVNSRDKILGISSLCFDLSVYDVFGALACGAALVMVPDQRDIRNLVETVEKHQVTIWNSVPAIMDIATEIVGNDTHKSIGSKANFKADIYKKGDFSEKLFYWSPIVYWKKEEDRLTIDNEVFNGFAVGLFPEFYYKTQNGISKEKLIESFDQDKYKVKAFVDKLIEKKVLVTSLLTPKEIFSTQGKLFKNEYVDEIIFVEESYKKYKEIQMNRSFAGCEGDEILFNTNVEYPELISNRRSCRKFNENMLISFETFIKLLSVFKQSRSDKGIFYNYACSGGLYPVDIFVYVKENRVEDLEGGLYYYNPIKDSIQEVKKDVKISDTAHYHTNKDIFRSSAFSVFFVYNAAVTMPKYSGNGYLYSFIDTGIMVSTLTNVSRYLGIGVCSIGDMMFERIEKDFNLDENQKWIHTVEVGIDNTCSEIIHETIKIGPNKQTKNGLCNEIEKNLEDQRFKSIRLVMMSGDWIPLELPEKVRSIYTNAKVISLGGATEGSIWSIYYPIDTVQPEWKSIPYGYPMANQRMYILNYNLEACPVGVQGEIHIGGIGVALGYLNDKERTDEAYIQHPKYGRLYKTGDFGVMRNSGYIEFLGRKDHQVKIKGYRVELGEIESCILKHDRITNAVVIDRTDSDGKKYLCAYYLAKEKIANSELKKLLASKLPAYMIPAYFIKVESIPLTANGKVDRNALPEPQPLDVEETKVIAGTRTEEIILALWQKHLGVNAPGIEDNFFDFGGDSIQLVRVHNELDLVYPGKIRLTDIFNNPTIKKLAKFIDQQSDDARKVINLNAVKMNEDFALIAYDNMNQDKRIEYKFSIDDKTLEKAKSMANELEVGIDDIMVSTMVFLFAKISGCEDISIQTMLENRDLVKSVRLDLKGLEDFRQLFEKAFLERTSTNSIYNLNELQDVYIERGPTCILPFIYREELLNRVMSDINMFDINFGINESVEKIEFVCDFNSSRIGEEHIEEIIDMFIEILDVLLDASKV